MTERALQLMKEIAFGLNSIVGTGTAPTITIELDRNRAEQLAWAISDEIRETLLHHSRAEIIVQLGRPFQYRGVNFRIVEKAHG